MDFHNARHHSSRVLRTSSTPALFGLVIALATGCGSDDSAAADAGTDGTGGTSEADGTGGASTPSDTAGGDADSAGSGDGVDGDSGDATADSDTGEPVCAGDIADDGFACSCGCEEGRCIACGRFETKAMPWGVPEGGWDGAGFNVIGTSYWSTLDINGDGLPDLVSTSPTDDGVTWGYPNDTHWRVFLNEGDGFAAAHATWDVPDGGWTGAGFNGIGSSYWSTLDINGDDLPDLVSTSAPDDGVTWGYPNDTHWRVFLNEGDGFAAAHTAWDVPDGGWPGAGFNGIGSSYWSTLDINGDDLPDLVSTSAPDDGVTWGYPNDTHWRAFLNDGSGFAAAHTAWDVPDGGWDGAGFNGIGTSYWSTLDINGDDLPDLVSTSATDDGVTWGYPNDTHWRAFLNDGSSFAAAHTAWDVPEGGWDGAGFNVFGTSYWSTLDINGDELPDLVSTSATDDGVTWGYPSDTHWRAFLNER